MRSHQKQTKDHISRQQPVDLSASEYFKRINDPARSNSRRVSSKAPVKMYSGIYSPALTKKKVDQDVKESEAIPDLEERAQDNKLDVKDSVAYKILKHLLYKYEQSLVKQDIMMLMKKSDRLCTFKTIEMLHGYNSILKKSDISYLLISIQPKELHQMFLEFYRMFDADHNYMVDFSEFNAIIQYVGSENIMGSKKIEVLIDLLIMRDDPFFQGGAKLAGETVDQETSKKLFESFNPIQTRQDKVVNFLVFFPFFLSFYFQYFLALVKKSRNRFDLVKGIEFVNDKEQEIENILSLNSILKEIGTNYLQEKDVRKLSYRDIENILLKYKNLNVWMTYQHVAEILKVFERKMRVEYRTKVEKKRLRVEKVMNLITQKFQIDYIEGYVCIMIAHQKKPKLLRDNEPPFLGITGWMNLFTILRLLMNGYLLNDKGDLLRQDFEDFLDRHYPDEQMEEGVIRRKFNKETVIDIYTTYLRKRFPMMSKSNITKIVDSYHIFKEEAEQDVEPELTKDQLIGTIFEQLCFRGDKKLLEYLDKNRKAHREVIAQKKLESMRLQSKSGVKISNEELSQPEVSQSINQLVENDDDKSNEDEDRPIRKQPPKDILQCCFIMEQFLEKYVHSHVKNFSEGQHAKDFLADEKREAGDEKTFDMEAFQKKSTHKHHNNALLETEEDQQDGKRSQGVHEKLDRALKNIKSGKYEQQVQIFENGEEQEQSADEDRGAQFIPLVLNNVMGLKVENNQNYKLHEITQQQKSKDVKKTDHDYEEEDEKDVNEKISKKYVLQSKRFPFKLNEDKLSFEKQRQKNLEESNRRDRCCNIF